MSLYNNLEDINSGIMFAIDEMVESSN